MFGADAFEEAVEVAASVLWASAAEDHHVALVTGEPGGAPSGRGPEGGRACLDRLAAVARRPDRDLVPVLEAVRRGPRGGWLVLVTGAADPAALAAVAALREGFAPVTVFDLSGWAQAVDVPGVVRSRSGPRRRRWRRGTGGAACMTGGRAAGAGGGAGRVRRRPGLGADVHGGRAAPLVAAVLAPVLLADLLTWGTPRLAGARPVLGLLGGAAALVAVLVLTRGATPAEVADGLVNGWQRTLASTLPAWPDADQVPFVPALVLVAGVLGVEWARHSGAPLPVLLPSFAVLVLAQLFHAAQGWTATATAAGYAIAVAAVLAAGRRGPAGRTAGRRLPAALGAVALLVPILALVGAGTWAGSAMMSGRRRLLHAGRPDRPPARRPRRGPALGDRGAAGRRRPGRVPGADRDRGRPVAAGRAGHLRRRRLGQLRAGADPGHRARRAGLRAPGDDRRGGGHRRGAGGAVAAEPAGLRGVTGLRALVDPATGVLLRPDAQAPPAYRLRWDDLRVDREQFAAATIDPAPVGSVELAEVPAGMAELARAAVGPGAGPTVQSALVLERWMRDGYAVAEGADIPTGHGYPQLLHFLTTSRRGTSEQFATAYAVLARSIGIPTRVVVGFRDDGSGTVHDRDALAWPEVAVSGLGWLPLDPTGGARTGVGGEDGLAAATEAARADLPGPGPCRRPPPPRSCPPRPPTGRCCPGGRSRSCCSPGWSPCRWPRRCAGRRRRRGPPPDGGAGGLAGGPRRAARPGGGGAGRGHGPRPRRALPGGPRGPRRPGAVRRRRAVVRAAGGGDARGRRPGVGGGRSGAPRAAGPLGPQPAAGRLRLRVLADADGPGSAGAVRAVERLNVARVDRPARRSPGPGSSAARPG